MGKERLNPVPLGHDAIAAGKHGRDGGKRFGMFDQGDAGALGQRFAGQIVLGRSESPGDQDELRPLDGSAERRQMVGQDIAQGRVERHDNAQI